MQTIDYEDAFSKMTKNLDIFVETVRSKNSKLMATDKWSVKDVLSHITFWHINYAANYKALSLHQDPPLLDGPGYKLNDEGVRHFKHYSRVKLISLLYEAQDSLYQNIVIDKIPQLTYKKNGRVYDTQTFLHLIERHLRTHTIQVRRGK